MSSLLASDPELKMAAQRAFVAYIRSCHVMSDKSVFNVAVSEPFQLPAPPPLPFIQDIIPSLSVSSWILISPQEAIFCRLVGPSCN